MAGEDMDGTELQPGYRIGLIVNEDNVVKKLFSIKIISSYQIYYF